MSEDIKLSKNVKLNSDALLKNLEMAEERLKNGEPVSDAFNKADLMWYSMTEEDRNKWKSRLEPEPTKEYTEKLIELMNKYDTV